MPREYRHINQYANEIYELREKGLNLKEIGEKLGFTHAQVRSFIHRENKNRRKLAAGIIPKQKGRPRVNGSDLPPSIQQLSKLTQLQYELASKERRLKQLKMENELMRDFLSLTERK